MKNKFYQYHWFQVAIPLIFVFTLTIKGVNAQVVISDKSLIMSDLKFSTATNLEILTTEISVDENTQAGEIVDTVKTNSQDTILFEIAEKSPPLSVVGEVQASDPDSGDVLQFSLLENPNDIFTIDAATWDILVNDSSYLD